MYKTYIQLNNIDFWLGKITKIQRNSKKIKKIQVKFFLKGDKKSKYS